jgi:hypothetical protein
MAGKVRFSKQVQPGDAARLRELVPHRLANDAETEIADDLFANAAKRFNIAKQFRRTTLRVYQPLGAKIHYDSLLKFRLSSIAGNHRDNVYDSGGER